MLPLFALAFREYAPIDGMGNNRAHPQAGAVGAPYLREHVTGTYYEPSRPNPREISNLLQNSSLARIQRSPQNLSVLWSYWGQFVTFELTHAVTNSSEKVSIPVPRCDPWLDPDCSGSKTIGFARTKHLVVDSMRHQLNANTAFFDGEPIYGNNDMLAKGLRARSGQDLLCELKTSPSQGLPDNDEVRASLSGSGHYMSSRDFHSRIRKSCQINAFTSQETNGLTPFHPFWHFRSFSFVNIIDSAG